MATSVPQSAPSLKASISPTFAVTKAFAIHRPRPDPDTFDACRPPPTKEPFPKTHPFLSNEADALVLDRQHNRVAVASRGNGNRRAGAEHSLAGPFQTEAAACAWIETQATIGQAMARP